MYYMSNYEKHLHHNLQTVLLIFGRRHATGKTWLKLHIHRSILQNSQGQAHTV